MKTAGELFENAIFHWRDAKGIGTALIPAPLNDKLMVLGILQRIYARSPTCDVILMVSSFAERTDLMEFLTSQGDEENDTEFRNLINSRKIKVFTYDFLNKGAISSIPVLCIAYRPTDIKSYVKNLLEKSKFKLIVLNKLLDKEYMDVIYSIAPILDDFKQAEIDEARTSTPVEETRIGVEIPEDSNAFALLKYCNEYITTSISIFGSFEIMQQARQGNSALNISASQICAQIAAENGWNEHLDMSIEFNVQIDELYNPGKLKDRASQTYEEIRKRSHLLSDYDGKLDKILDIIQENPNKKILIINKRGEFANTITEYINMCSGINICGNYHDKVEPIPAIDRYGNPLYYKTGQHKGERRYMAAQAQKSFNESAFNRGELRILSTSNAPDKELCIDVDIIIITSPQCEDIKSYMYRLSNIGYRSGIIHLYNIFCKNSMEEKLLDSATFAENHTLLNNCKNSVVSENNSDFIIVD